MSRSRARLATALVVATCLITLSGCAGPGYDDLSFPRPAAGERFRLDALFDDALNLAVGAPVKVDGLTVGEVSSVRIDGVRARVALDVDDGTVLPVGTHARLRYDTPLGEVYVEMTTPDRAAGRRLRDGDVLDGGRTSTATTVEDTLAQASLLVNGGGLTQLGTITDELNLALDGREPEVRETVRSTAALLRGLDDGRDDLGAALDDLDTAAAELEARRATLRKAVTRLGPAADVLADQQGDLTRLVAETDDLATRADGLLSATERDLLTVLRELGPVLQSILDSKDDLISTYTSVKAAADRLQQAVPGDFIGLDATIRLDLGALLGGTSPSTPPTGGTAGSGASGGLPGLPGLPGLGLPDRPKLDGLLGQRGGEREP